MAGETDADVTLDRIREGGTMLIALARQRLTEVEAAIDEGRFADAMRLTAELELKLTPLAYAEDHIALRGGMILRAGNLKEGMKVQGFGTVQALTRIECEDHFHLDVDFAEHEASPMRLHEKQEVVVQVDDEQ
jgi:hypothetical protein